MKTSICPALALFAIYFMTACSDGGVWTSEDPWHEPPPPGLALGTAADSSRIHVVSEEFRDKAEKMLADTWIEELEWEKVTEWLESKPAEFENLTPFLVRAVYLSEHGAFSLYENEKSIVIISECMGTRALPMKRIPLVVFLASKPERVYTTCSMTE
ncbi:MAG: hypothetical protein NUW37_05310 [Planctomycetes bacterium]|nr:hypothetical protein [Planctomycetota bacterium]